VKGELGFEGIKGWERGKEGAFGLGAEIGLPWEKGETD
jgi:hypothetical protein